MSVSKLFWSVFPPCGLNADQNNSEYGRFLSNGLPKHLRLGRMIITLWSRQYSAHSILNWIQVKKTNYIGFSKEPILLELKHRLSNNGTVSHSNDKNRKKCFFKKLTRLQNKEMSKPFATHKWIILIDNDKISMKKCEPFETFNNYFANNYNQIKKFDEVF